MPGNRTVPAVCRQCGANFLAFRRSGKYCSRRCYHLARRRSVTVRCRQCRRRFAVPPSQAGRRYCSRRCWRLAVAPRTFTCRACGTEFLSRTWRNPRFCSLSCANRGRVRRRRPGDVARNALILQLHAQGLKAPQIRDALAAENRGWLLEAGSIRMVIAREERAAPAGGH